MAEKTVDVQGVGITFGDWKLFPVDPMNWELCHRHATTRGASKGTVKWNRLGRFYQHNTVPQAIQYAADCELKDKAREQALTLQEALDEYRAIIDAMRADVIRAMGGAA